MNPFIPGRRDVRAAAQGNLRKRNIDYLRHLSRSFSALLLLGASLFLFTTQLHAAPACTLETTAPTLGQTIDRTTVEQVPINGRLFTSFIVMCPGAVDPGAKLTVQSNPPLFSGGGELIDLDNPGVSPVPGIPQGNGVIQFSVPERIQEFQVYGIQEDWNLVKPLRPVAVTLMATGFTPNPSTFMFSPPGTGRGARANSPGSSGRGQDSFRIVPRLELNLGVNSFPDRKYDCQSLLSESTNGTCQFGKNAFAGSVGMWFDAYPRHWKGFGFAFGAEYIFNNTLTLTASAGPTFSESWALHTTGYAGGFKFVAPIPLPEMKRRLSLEVGPLWDGWSSNLTSAENEIVTGGSGGTSMVTVRHRYTYAGGNPLYVAGLYYNLGHHISLDYEFGYQHQVYYPYYDENIIQNFGGVGWCF